jgi:hopene-associated glycosyltransferase HpnB
MSLLIGLAAAAIWVYLIVWRGGFWRFPQRALPAAPPAARSVVAVVPARDEASVIGRALASLFAQDYRGRFHVVLVDDQSSDGTAAVARMAAAECGAADRLSLCRGAPVPHGWTGKLWAVHQGVALARALVPDYLLLTDADIVHDPGNVRELVGRAEAEGRDLVSLMVRLNVRSLWEKLLIPAFTFFFFKIYPPRWVADAARSVAAAAGGCMLIRPAALDRIGGIASIRREIIDDCALARRVKAVGTVSLEFSRQTNSIREYRSWRPIWDMVARSAFAQLGYSGAALVATLALLALTYLAPPLLLLSSSPEAAALGGAAWAAMSVAFVPALRAHRAPAALAPLLPLIALFYAAATLASAIAFWRGRGGSWKGRFQAAAPRA